MRLLERRAHRIKLAGKQQQQTNKQNKNNEQTTETMDPNPDTVKLRDKQVQRN